MDLLTSVCYGERTCVFICRPPSLAQHFREHGVEPVSAHQQESGWGGKSRFPAAMRHSLIFVGDQWRKMMAYALSHSVDGAKRYAMRVGHRADIWEPDLPLRRCLILRHRVPQHFHTARILMHQAHQDT